MAKGKRAAALFEVIHTGGGEPLARPNRPRWWFKFKPQKTATRAEPEISAPISTPVVAEVAVADVPSEQRISEPVRADGVDVALDREHQQITFKLSYTSAMIVAFSILVVLALSYLVGKKMSRAGTLAIATRSSEQLRAGPAHPDVLDVTSKANVSPRDPDTGTSSTSARVGSVDDAAQLAGANSPASSQRSVNLNYVVIQSYPDEKSAEDARDALLKAGVGCTVEHGLRGFKADWPIVVGTQGFARVKNDASYTAYLQKLDQISQQFAQSKRSFKAFAPMAYKWDKSAPADAGR